MSLPGPAARSTAARSTAAKSAAAKSASGLRAAGAGLRGVPGRLGGLTRQAVTWAAQHHLTAGGIVVLVAAATTGAIIVAEPAQPGGARAPGRYPAASAAGYFPARPPYPVRAPLPMPSAYTGVYEPTAAGGWYVPLVTGSHASGKPPKIAVYYSGWSQGFNTNFADNARTSGAVPLVQIEPRGVSLAAIARGSYDSYLRTLADAVVGYQGAVIIGFGQEINEPRSWGNEKPRGAAYVQAWRHIVSVFRSQNADNVTWIWMVGKIGATSSPLQDWWPGAQYVTWVGIDGYYQLPPHAHTSPFAATIAGVRHLTGAPVLLFGDDKSAS
jgi:hypothetical protein